MSHAEVAGLSRDQYPDRDERSSDHGLPQTQKVEAVSHQSVTRPRRAPSVTASVRLLASSLERIEATWNLTVCRLMERRFAMILLGSPCAINCNTSRSRAVSVSSAGGDSVSRGAGVRAEARWSARLRSSATRPAAT